MMRLSVFALLAFALLMSSGARAADATPPEQHLSIKDHVFNPNDLTVPAGQKIKLIIKNEDSSSAEFESEDLNREKVVPANKEVTVYLDPMTAGTYTFFDDFHRTTTTGTITAQ